MGLLHFLVKYKRNVLKKGKMRNAMEKRINREGLEKLKVTFIDSLQDPSTLHLTLKQYFFEVDTSIFPARDEETSSERSLL